MSSTLSEGVRVPDIGSVNWGADVNFNWGLLNTALANISGNVKVDAENTWTAPQTFTETISGSIDGVAARAVGDEDGNNIKSAIAGKQPSLSQAQLDAVNSGITSAAVQQIGTNASNISGLQTAVASKAADSDVVHLAGAETISGDKTWTGLNTFHSITPETTGTYSLGSSSYQWSSVYAQTYYYNGTAWGLDKANVWSQNQTFPGITILNTSWSGVTPPSSTKATIIEFKNSDTRQGRYINRIGVNSAETWIETIRNVDANISHNFTAIFSVDNAGNKKLVPYNSDADLGESISSSAGRWKTLNGINPGALSLPSNSGVSFSGDITDTTGTVTNPKTWTVNGWGYIRVPNRTTSDFVSVVTSGSYEAYLATGTGAGNTNIGVSFPIVAGRTYNIYVSTSGNVTAYYFPCLGNV